MIIIMCTATLFINVQHMVINLSGGFILQAVDSYIVCLEVNCIYFAMGLM